MIDEILNSLQDGKSHSLEEIMTYVRCHCHSPIPSERKVVSVFLELRKYDFVLVDQTNGSEPSVWLFQLNSVFAEWLRRIKKME